MKAIASALEKSRHFSGRHGLKRVAIIRICLTGFWSLFLHMSPSQYCCTLLLEMLWLLLHTVLVDAGPVA